MGCKITMLCQIFHWRSGSFTRKLDIIAYNSMVDETNQKLVKISPTFSRGICIVDSQRPSQLWLQQKIWNSESIWLTQDSCSSFIPFEGQCGTLQNFKKGVTDRRTGNAIHRAAWSQLKTNVDKTTTMMDGSALESTADYVSSGAKNEGTHEVNLSLQASTLLVKFQSRSC